METFSECQVCTAPVSTKLAKTCEACRKFFSRHSEKDYTTLRCSTGYDNCTITEATRMACIKCRFDKCIAIGLKPIPPHRKRHRSPPQHGASAGAGNVAGAMMALDEQPSTPEMDFVGHQPSPQKLFCYNNQFPESFFSKVPQQQPKPAVAVASSFSSSFTSETFEQKQNKILNRARVLDHVTTATEMCILYANYLSDCDNVMDTESLQDLYDKFAAKALTLFCRKKNENSSSSSNSDDLGAMHLLMSQFPQYKESFSVQYALQYLVEHWQPPSPRSTSSSDLQVKAHHKTTEVMSEWSLEKARRRLWLALDLLQHLVYQTNNNDHYFDNANRSREFVDKCWQSVDNNDNDDQSKNNNNNHRSQLGDDEVGVDVSDYDGY